MASDLTVAQARVPLGTVADPSGQHPELFIPLLDLASRSIIEAGQWKGTLGEVNFPSSSGYITLPRRWESILASRICCSVQPIYGRYHEFSTSGPSYFSDLEWCINGIIDQGEWSTEVAQTEALPIRLTIADEDDAGETVRLYGVDANGDVIFDSDGREGVEYTTVYPSVTTSESFILTNVVKPMMEGTLTISSVGSVVTVLSTYEPTETNPLYRRYKVGTHEARTDGIPIIRTLCKRRHIPLVHESDPVFPSNIRALGFAMNACKLEKDGAYEVAQANGYWAGCYEALNNSLKQYRGGARTPGAFIFNGSAGANRQTH